MKPIIRKTVLAATLVLALAASSFPVNATDNPYDNQVYYTTYIAIRNASKDSFTIKDAAGNIVLSGKITNKKNFTIKAEKLSTGTYQLYMGDVLTKKFDVQSPY